MQRSDRSTLETLQRVKEFLTQHPLADEPESLDAQAAEDVFLRHGLAQGFIERLLAAATALEENRLAKTESVRRRTTVTASVQAPDVCGSDQRQDFRTRALTM